MDKQIIVQEKFVVKAARQWAHFHPVTAALANGRMEKAIDLAVSGHVRAQGQGLYIVLGQTTAKAYAVYTGGASDTCECPDGALHDYCKHILAALFASQAQATEGYEREKAIEREQEQIERAEIERDPDYIAEHDAWYRSLDWTLDAYERAEASMAVLDAAETARELAE